MSSSEDCGCRSGQSPLRGIPSSLHAVRVSDSPVYSDPNPPLSGEQSVVLEQSSHSRDEAEQDQADHDQSDHDQTDQTDQDQSDHDQTDQDQSDQDQILEACTLVEDLLAGYCLDSPLEFTIPKTSFFRLINDPKFESDREELKLKISYDASKSVLTIFPMSGRRHSRVVSWVTQLAYFALHEFDSPIRSKVRLISNEDFVEFEGAWQGSLRAPDFGIALKEDIDSLRLHTLVEVNSSLSRAKMVEVMNIYLKGAPTVSRVILINITEAPKYKAPKNIDWNELKTNDKTEFQCDSNQGPLWYKGIQWVGQITISWEVWERCPISGKPKQICEASIIPAECGSQLPFAKMLPFFMVPTTIAPGGKAVTIKPADIDLLWHEWLRDAVRDEAVRRIALYVRDQTRRSAHAAKIAEQEDQANNKKRTEREARARRRQQRNA